MGNVFTLDSLREEVEREFAPVKIVVADGEEVTLRNMLRLPKRQRERVTEKLGEMETTEESEDTDTIGRLAGIALDVLTLVADRPEKLVDELEGDAGLVLKVLNKWMESSQPGEAQPSPA